MSETGVLVGSSSAFFPGGIREILLKPLVTERRSGGSEEKSENKGIINVGQTILQEFSSPISLSLDTLQPLNVLLVLKSLKLSLGFELQVSLNLAPSTSLSPPPARSTFAIYPWFAVMFSITWKAVLENEEEQQIVRAAAAM
ncbi:hypothetical protein TURU_121116 [Turdus rufiventris]|nr:hypothetical protein TURU_121116 [Turdus rufiventris]